MQVHEVLAELERLGSASTQRVMASHGAPQGYLGVKVADLKVVEKRIRRDHALALDLYRTGQPDAMYLAGLVADGRRMTREELDAWARAASWHLLAEYTVPWVAAESPHGRDLALAWIDDADPRVATSGWCTYGGWVALQPDEALDLPEIEGLLDRVAASIHEAPNRVRYCMNGFVIAVGCYVAPLRARAEATAAAVGKVHVDMGGTACKVPSAVETIGKVAAMGRTGRKRRTLKC